MIRLSCLQDSKDGSTVHLELDVGGLRMRYITADNLGIFPANDSARVAELAKRLGLDLRALFKLEKKRENEPFLVLSFAGSRSFRWPACVHTAGNRKLPLPGTVVSVEDALTYYCDFSSLARAKLLKASLMLPCQT